MIERLLSIRCHFEECLQELNHYSLSNTEWNRLADRHRLLSPFNKQTDALQTDTLSLNSATISVLELSTLSLYSAIPSILELSLHFQDQSLNLSYQLLHQHVDLLFWIPRLIFLSSSCSCMPFGSHGVYVYYAWWYDSTNGSSKELHTILLVRFLILIF